MEPLNDSELHDLLRQWEAPGAPAHLEDAVFRPPWYQWLLTGSVRVPVPALALLLVILAALAYVLRPVTARDVRLSDFQPVSEPRVRIIRGACESN